MISASSTADVVAAAAAAAAAATGPTTQRKRQRLDQLVGRIAHLVGTTGSATSAAVGSGRNINKSPNNNSPFHNNNNVHDRTSPLCGDGEGTDEDDQGVMATTESSSMGGDSSPSTSQNQQSVIASMSRLRMRGSGNHQLRHPLNYLNPQVFNFDHVLHHQHVVSDEEEGEEEVFSSPGLTPSSFSSASGGDRLTLSPCSQGSCTVDSPSCISFSPLSFAHDDAEHHHHHAGPGRGMSITRSLTSDPSTPLNLSLSSSSNRQVGITPPHASSSPRNLLAAPSDPVGNRRRARSDSDLRGESQNHVASETVDDAEASAALASWVLTPASSSSLNPSPPSGQSQPTQPSSIASRGRLSRLEHLRPPPLMVSFKRNSSDSTDSWPSPLFGQQESPVDLSVRSSAGSSISSDSPNQVSNTSTASISSSSETSAYSSSAGMETPPPRLMSSSTSSSRNSRLKVLTRSISLSHYLSAAAAEYSDFSVSVDASEHHPAPAYPCEVCGQIFDHHDRLVKHMASRHKGHQQQQQAQSQPPPQSRSPAGGDSAGGVVVKGYQCDVCQRPFARSDMLTRHMRLHTGLKPYTCRICGQVFSRSDHLSTHQRTHTGEKPYRCPQCSYAACRRDMITRHLRTHTRSEDLDGTGIMAASDPR